MAKAKKSNHNPSGIHLKGKQSLILLICAVLLIGSAFLLVRFEKWRFVDPFAPYVIENISSATVDEDGNTYAIVSSGEEIVKISAEGILEERYSGKDYDFTGATHIAYGGDGKIYVHLVHYSEGVRIEQEQVISLTPEGATIIARYPREKGAMRQSIISIMGTESGALYFNLNDYGLQVINQGKSTEKYYSLNNLEKYIISAVYDGEKDTLYYSTYDGKIFRQTGNQKAEKIYDCSEAEGSNPQDVALKDGSLYCADVGLRDVIVFDQGGDAYERLSEDAEFEDRSIAPIITGTAGGVTTVSEYDVFHLEGTTLEAMDAPTLSQRYVWETILTWAALGIFFLCAAALAVMFIIYIINRSTTSTKLSIAVIFLVVGVGALFLGLLFPNFQERFENEIFLREQFAAKATLQKIDQKNLGEITGPADYMSEAYLDIKDSASDVFMNGEADKLYCMIYRQIDDAVYVIYTLEDLYAAYPTEYTPEDLEELKAGEFARLKSSTSQGNYLYVQLPLTDEHRNVVGFIEVGTETTEITETNNEMLRNLIINVLAMTVVVILFALEIISYMSGKKEYDIEWAKLDRPVKIPPKVFRFIVFLVFFFTNLTCAILPIYATKIAGSLRLFGLSSEFLAAIPISAEVFSGALFSAIGSKVIRKLGPKKSIILSSLCFTAGLAVRIVPNLFTLTLGSLILGMGWGIQLLMVNVQIAKLPEHEKDTGYAYYNIASLAGANSAVVLGGFLVQWVSYGVLFAITAVSSVILFFVSSKYLISEDGPEEEETAAEETQGKKMNPIRFVFNPRVICFFLFLLIPLLIGGYFLYYMFPIVASDWGLSETYIGYAYVLNGFFAVVLGKTATEFFSKGKRKPFGLFTAVVLYGGAFFLVSYYQSILSLLAALVILGIADSFGIPLLTNYYTDLRAVADYGYDRALGVYSLFENGAQSLGSLVFGIVLTVGVAKGLRTMIAVMGALAVCFLVSVLFCMKKEKKSGGL